MLGKPRILSLFPNSFRLINSIKHEHSCYCYSSISVMLAVGTEIVSDLYEGLDGESGIHYS